MPRDLHRSRFQATVVTTALGNLLPPSPVEQDLYRARLRIRSWVPAGRCFQDMLSVVMTENRPTLKRF